MESQLQRSVERALDLEEGSIRGSHAVGGGCINHASRLELVDGRRFFLKWNSAPLPGLFEREAEGLAALSSSGALRVPSSPLPGSPPPFLIMEWIESGAKGRDFSERFGRSLAEMHRDATGDRFGFDHDNYLGATLQPNSWSSDWVEFFRQRRLGHQLRLAREHGVADRELLSLGDRLMESLERFLAEPEEPPCLLHGDLWGGNYMVGASGEPVLIDPAAYYGRREADLAMTMLFGGFDRRFYAAYEESWPLATDSPERLEIYKLYHLLNHLNLFGGGYLGSCLQILRGLVC